MPSIQTPVLPSSNMNFLRLSLNQLATNLNDIFNNSFIVNGNIIISVSDSSAIALNVSNGTIRGNGSQIFSINALSLLGTANNSQLQNTTITIIAANGLASNVTTVSLGGAMSINVNVIDSITSTATNLPASANSLRWAMQAANANSSNASLITTYVVSEERGGTGKSTYLPGQLLIGNTLSGKLDKSSISPGSGIAISGANGSITVSANLIQGTGILLQSSGNSGITISSNAYPDGSTTTEGIVRLYDAANSISTTLAVTPNAVNAVVSTLNSVPSKNVFGRLLSRHVYTTSNFAGITGQESGTTHIWTKPLGTDYINIMIISGGAAGGSSQNAWNDTETRFTPKVYLPNNALNRLRTAAFWGAPGEAGSTAYWTGPASSFGNTVTVFVGGGGTTRSGGRGNGADSWFGNTSFIRVPGAPQTNNFISNTTSDRASALWGDILYGRASLGGSNTEQIQQGQLYSPYSDSGHSTDPLSYDLIINAGNNSYRLVDSWGGFIKGANTLARDSGTYTDNPSSWETFDGISRGSIDAPALGLPWHGRADGMMLQDEVNKIWPFYGGKGGSTVYGRGGYGGLISTDRTTRVNTQLPFNSQSNNKPDEFPRVTGFTQSLSNFGNDLWYSFGGISIGNSYPGAPVYCANSGGPAGTGTDIFNDDAPIAYGEAPHILSITKGTDINESTNVSITLPETEAGDRLFLSLGCYIISQGQTPNGWILLPGTSLHNSPATNTSLYPTFYRDMTGTEGANITFGVTLGNGTSASRFVWTIFRVAKGTYDANSIPRGVRFAPTAAAGSLTPPVELDMTANIPASWGHRTNTMLYLTTWAGHAPNPSVGPHTFGFEPLPPIQLDLSFDTIYTSNTSVGRNVAMGYGLKIRKARPRWDGGDVTNATPQNFDYPRNVFGSIENIWTPAGQYDFSPFGGGTYNYGGPDYWNQCFVANTSGSTLQYTTMVVRGNTSPPWNLKNSASIDRNVISRAGTVVGQIPTGIWYYKFQHGQDATGYGAGGGSAVKGTGNCPWDLKSWQVHGGNGAPGLIIVEAYSSGNSIYGVSAGFDGEIVLAPDEPIVP